MAQFLSKCELFLQKARLAHLKARTAQSLCRARRLLDTFKDVHQSQGRCWEHLKATPASTLLSNLYNLIVPICWRHCRLKNVHCNDPFLMLGKASDFFMILSFIAVKSAQTCRQSYQIDQIKESYSMILERKRSIFWKVLNPWGSLFWT